jgi:hypothetical protein
MLNQRFKHNKSEYNTCCLPFCSKVYSFVGSIQVLKDKSVGEAKKSKSRAGKDTDIIISVP